MNVRQGLTAQGLEWALTSGYGGNWVPLTWVSHMLDCQFFGLDSGWHHLHNVLLHALAAVMLCIFLRAGDGHALAQCVGSVFICIASAACAVRGLGVRAQRRAQRLLLVPHSVAVCSICGTPRHGPISGGCFGLLPGIDGQADGGHAAIRPVAPGLLAVGAFSVSGAAKPFGRNSRCWGLLAAPPPSPTWRRNTPPR